MNRRCILLKLLGRNVNYLIGIDPSVSVPVHANGDHLRSWFGLRIDVDVVVHFVPLSAIRVHIHRSVPIPSIRLFPVVSFPGGHGSLRGPLSRDGTHVRRVLRRTASNGQTGVHRVSSHGKALWRRSGRSGLHICWVQSKYWKVIVQFL